MYTHIYNLHTNITTKITIMSTNTFNVLSSSPPSPTMMDGNNNSSNNNNNNNSSSKKIKKEIDAGKNVLKIKYPVHMERTKSC